MARFAHYYIKYKHSLAPYNWSERQKHMSALFEKDDSITFFTGEEDTRKVYKHRVYHLACAPDIIVMRFANNIDIPVEHDFQPATAKDEPSCFVIIDNRSGMRRIAIQRRKKAFGNPTLVADILQKVIDAALFHEHCYGMEILPEYYPEDLYKAWERLQMNMQAIRIGSISNDLTEDEILNKVEELARKNPDYFDNSLMSPLLKLILAAKKENYGYTQQLMREDRKAAFYLDKSSTIVRNMVTLSSALGEPVELVTNDGATFRCYVDSDADNTDKIVCSEIDTKMLERLFAVRDENGVALEPGDRVKAEGEVLEQMNRMKHESQDEEALSA